MSNFKKLSKDVKDNYNKEFGYWQTILDLGYGEWNREGSEIKDYDEMVEWMLETYGTFGAMAVLLGKYNHQVCNGGHSQYWNNGYASNGGGCFSGHEDTYLHDKMVEWMKEERPKVVAKIEGEIERYCSADSDETEINYTPEQIQEAKDKLEGDSHFVLESFKRR